jgi:hypothetical protein
VIDKSAGGLLRVVADLQGPTEVYRRRAEEWAWERDPVQGPPSMTLPPDLAMPVTVWGDRAADADDLVTAPAGLLLRFKALLVAVGPLVAGPLRRDVEEAQVAVDLELRVRFGENVHAGMQRRTYAGMLDAAPYLTDAHLRTPAQQLVRRVDLLAAGVERAAADAERYTADFGGGPASLEADAWLLRSVDRAAWVHLRAGGPGIRPVSALHSLAESLSLAALHTLPLHRERLREGCLERAETCARIAGHVGSTVTDELVRLGPGPRPQELAALYRLLTRRVGEQLPALLGPDLQRSVAQELDARVGRLAAGAGRAARWPTVDVPTPRRAGPGENGPRRPPRRG